MAEKKETKEQSITNYLSRQESASTLLFALQTNPEDDQLVTAYIWSSLFGCSSDVFIEIPKKSIDKVISTDQLVECDGNQLELVRIIFKKGEEGSINLTEVSKLISRLLGALYKEYDEIKARRGERVDAVVPRLRGQNKELSPIKTFSRPIL